MGGLTTIKETQLEGTEQGKGPTQWLCILGGRAGLLFLPAKTCKTEAGCPGETFPLQLSAQGFPDLGAQGRLPYCGRGKSRVEEGGEAQSSRRVGWGTSMGGDQAPGEAPRELM